ncbi:hypothetical protein [Paraburkholderia sp. J8-2]|uniref:hypothetical protein n=1 Tax=Paraburkholderia sp. J8-2 TaxID=2805440 RepID=UPI002AB6CF7E|nr:hypothetical protein [Paraburkholderia sp. J8-2]
MSRRHTLPAASRGLCRAARQRGIPILLQMVAVILAVAVTEFVAQSDTTGLWSAPTA